MRSTLEVCYEGKASDSIYHVNDHWIEPKDNSSPAELDKYVKKVAREAVAPREGGPADVIFSSAIDDAGLLATVKAGAGVAGGKLR
jgi:hypothetical protein